MNSRKKQLYEKLPNGRYAPYKEPPVDDSSQIFRKEYGKYRPCGCLVHDDHLTEGVWVVTKGNGRKHITSGNYIDGLFRLDKVANLAKLTIAERAGLSKIIDDVYFSHDDDYRGKSEYEVFAMKVSAVIDKLLK